MSRASNDVGPKLREEKHFNDFYPDLDANDLIPILVSQETDQSQSVDSQDEIIRKQHYKQLIFNGSITVEPITITKQATDVQQIPYPVNDFATFIDAKRYSKKSVGNTLISKFYSQDHIQGKTKRRQQRIINAHDSDKIYKDKFMTHSNQIKRDKAIQSHFEALSPNLSGFIPQYDMDEQDALYLEFLNQSLGEKYITAEVFEIIITILELEWYHLDKHIPPKITDTNDSQLNSIQHHANKVRYELYGSDDGTGLTSDQACAVCDGTVSTTTNMIVFCDGCDIAVHQECYGIVFIPEGQWLCRRCFISRNKQVNCVTCPSTTGAFKQTHTGSWAHVLCALWIPELVFANLHYMEPIEGVENINKSRWKLVCYICKLRVGACIQCSNKNCFAAYHVTCAKRAGLCLDTHDTSIAEMASKHYQMHHHVTSYCDKHSPPGWPSCAEGIMKTRRYFANRDAISEVSKEKQLITKGVNSEDKNSAHWKTNKGTPIAPMYFTHIIQKVLVMFDISNEIPLSILLCKYWAMKRELRKGAPLVRVHTNLSYNSQNESYLNDRIQFIDSLLGDLQSLGNISRLIKERVNATKSFRATNKKINEVFTSPKEYFFRRNVLSKFLHFNAFTSLLALLDKHTIVDHSVNALRNSTSATFIENVEAFVNFASTKLDETRLTSDYIHRISNYAKELSAQFDKVDYEREINMDFEVNKEHDKLSVSERLWKGPILQQEEGLSDVEELTPSESRIVNNLPIEKEKPTKVKRRKKWKKSY
ncbi:uncharacterized protein GVI51_K05093 [Nakaseomyces glabratus]|uniref:NuA3 HAT complex component NTO1 n=1 Tax=Candida glabrata (strain ATCC 2001 / BCRC 20586 / JCM 3761 / NBRC 0622 / NRRL Y-65 / CBS 138) TaxID=284593 RepID=Q6FMU0_CANGA|nr:uncharacterized protein CAGL0K05269g [Nakaseomyces glabratus]KAH7597013.1 PHD-zinc-finger like domain [Nakaseomyces glabratus]KAH7602785.1 PHD-zinc-finger like domain [Nakaseomyces glabratus]QHS68111.1 uncharacterized protein GVI51_K05093 [Nakaseomyces glabratus]CAG61415.1 unnamed protein product [Nakaseomyces glabratus]|eukprot:XP_448454.1 uncharacterized protein CAGL0K05269g [[Candida] glabrata]